MKRAIILILVISTLLIAFASCQITGCSYAELDYDDALKYKKGNGSIEANITCLEIEWLLGSVNFEFHDKNTIEFSETSSLEIDNKHTLRYYKENNTLHIKYGKNGRFALGVGAIEKNLTIKLPIGYALDELEIDAVSASINSDDTLKVKNAEIETVSGGASMLLDVYDEIELTSVSGNIAIIGNINKAEITSVSGDINLSSLSMNQCDITSTSGTVALSVKEENFTLTTQTVSGSVSCDFLTTSYDGSYVCGNGENKYDITTVSGYIMVKKIIE